MTKVEYKDLLTEQRNPASMDLDTKSIEEILRIINEEDKKVPFVVEKEIPNIAKAVELVVKAFKSGGRLIYVGAGTSGRLGVLDASECPPTFGASFDMVQGIIAGGPAALMRSIEGAEDHPEDGAKAIDEKNVNEKDVVCGIATSSVTPFVVGAIKRAKERGAKTISITCHPESELANISDVAIKLLVGPEVITGSTRMKAGTATKLVLNMITTTAMVKIGKVYGNLMVDVQAWNQKLKDRAKRIIMTITGVDKPTAERYLELANWSVKVAIVMIEANASYEEAVEMLNRHEGMVRKAIEAIRAHRV